MTQVDATMTRRTSNKTVCLGEKGNALRTTSTTSNFRLVKWNEARSETVV